MVTFVNSTYSGSSKQYAVSGVRVLEGPMSGGSNDLRLQLAGTNLEFDIPVDYDTALLIQKAISKSKNNEEEDLYTPEPTKFDIGDVELKDLVEELYNRFNN